MAEAVRLDGRSATAKHGDLFMKKDACINHSLRASAGIRRRSDAGRVRQVIEFGDGAAGR